MKGLELIQLSYTKMIAIGITLRLENESSQNFFLKLHDKMRQFMDEYINNSNTGLNNKLLYLQDPNTNLEEFYKNISNRKLSNLVRGLLEELDEDMKRHTLNLRNL